eukprot:6045868-Ditylum_brightwellii.AAC.1
MLSIPTNVPSIKPTSKCTKVSTPDSSKILTKLPNKDKTKANMLLCTVITPQNDKAYSNQANIKATTTNTSLIIPIKPCKWNPKESHILVSSITGTTIANDINSEMASPTDEHTVVSNKNNTLNSTSTSKTLTEPTHAPMSSKTKSNLKTMMIQMMTYMDLHFTALENKQMPTFSSSMSKADSKNENNQDSIKKIESNLNNMSHTIFKVEHRLKKEEET